MIPSIVGYTSDGGTSGILFHHTLTPGSVEMTRRISNRLLPADPEFLTFISSDHASRPTDALQVAIIMVATLS